MGGAVLIVVAIVTILVGAGLGYAFAALKYLAELHAAKLELQKQMAAAAARAAEQPPPRDPATPSAAAGSVPPAESRIPEPPPAEEPTTAPVKKRKGASPPPPPPSATAGVSSAAPAQASAEQSPATESQSPTADDSAEQSPPAQSPVEQPAAEPSAVKPARPPNSQPAEPVQQTRPRSQAPAAARTAKFEPPAGSWQALINEAANRAQSDVLCIVDIDFLRQYRERYGQELGGYVSDHVLRVMQDTLRETAAVISRYEGQEFIITWPAELGSKTKRLWAARKITAGLRADVERAFLQVGSERLTITLSLGIALCEPGLTGEQVIALADEALAAAKKAGRNRGYYHTGSECRAVEPLDKPDDDAVQKEHAARKQANQKRSHKSSGRERRRHERQPCNNINLIAPCTDGVLPGMDKFQRVQFFDISSSGFSMLVPTVPTTSQFAVALINSRGMIFVAAEVANVRQAPRATSTDRPLLIVGCKFLQRLHPPGEPRPASNEPPQILESLSGVAR